MLTVTVNDRPIDVAAIVERGRVLLPMRATFTALGASVGYDPRGRVIVARSAAHALRLAIGSHEAIVDGRRMTLDVPARIVATRTYVPLRFAAQAMGAVVGYDAQSNLVSVISGPSADARGTVSHAADVLDLLPAPQSVIGSAYPTISASLGSASASRSDVTLTVDGEDVTALASFDGTTITYMPRIGLSRGPHTVRFWGRTLAQHAFLATWTFQTSLQAPPDAPSFDTYDYRFYASGPTFYYPGDWMHFVLIAPPGGSAQLQLCGMGFQYALWSTGYGSVYEANFPAPRGYWMPSCAVTAIYTAWNGQQHYVPIPVIIGIYTGAQPGTTPRPKPTPSPRPIPIGPRRPEPTATPRPLPTRHPLPLPHPSHTPPPVQHTPAPVQHTAAPAPRTPAPIIRRPLPLPHPVRTP
ncbi:MAG TPA: stalk domain-containing protein [Candidatus Baltobacteraceae bacterium]|nr:stalk domain-containing protein [Candidatus Baltobacteraceae bacterium]